LDDPSVENEQVHVDGTRGEPGRAAGASDRQLDRSSESFEGIGIEFATQGGGDVEVRGSLGAVGRVRLVERRNREDLGVAA
jgi:hypothetical protein